MMRPSEHNVASSDGKLPWWAFPLAAVALVRAPPHRGDSSQVAAEDRVIWPSLGTEETGEDAPLRRRLTSLPRAGRTSSGVCIQCSKASCDRHRGGVTFYALLAIFPGIAALVAIYGLIADPSTISQHLSDLSGVLPGGATEVIGDQLRRLTSQPPGKLGFALVFGLGVSLWSANAGMKALFDLECRLWRGGEAQFSQAQRGVPRLHPWAHSSSWCSRLLPLPCSRS
jgi:Virulence factor BrkB